MIEYRQTTRNPNYRVGTDGSFWSRKRGKWKRLKPRRINKYGHLQVTSCQNGIPTQIMLHTLILETFLGPCPFGMNARHYPDRNPSNNNLSNLSWATQLINQRDRKTHGTSNEGEKSSSAKLTERKVIKIRKMYKSGTYTLTYLGGLFGIHPSQVHNIVTRKQWTHI